MAARKLIGLWLLCGVVMIYIQIILGGITRLTGSGLSITKWEIVTGTVPPTSTAKWQVEFDHYKATPQYKKLNNGMLLSQFKQIYFWEYAHRLWARMMGFVFAIPFFIFLYQGKLNRSLIKQLVVIIMLSSLVASFGWIMVKSGLIDRPWVSPYKLTAHLGLALITYVYLLWVCLQQLVDRKSNTYNFRFKKWAGVLLLFLAVQMILGGLMSGMKAGLLYPTFPDMNGQFIPAILTDFSNWSITSFTHYDFDAFAISIIHFSHRMVAYLIVVTVTLLFITSRKIQSSAAINTGIYLIITATSIQVVLGVLTVINSLGSIPVTLGVFHQAGAILVLTATVYLYFMVSAKPTVELE